MWFMVRDGSVVVKGAAPGSREQLPQLCVQLLECVAALLHMKGQVHQLLPAVVVCGLGFRLGEGGRGNITSVWKGWCLC